MSILVDDPQVYPDVTTSVSSRTSVGHACFPQHSLGNVIDRLITTDTGGGRGDDWLIRVSILQTDTVTPTHPNRLCVLMWVLVRVRVCVCV